MISLFGWYMNDRYLHLVTNYALWVRLIKNRHKIYSSVDDYPQSDLQRMIKQIASGICAPELKLIGPWGINSGFIYLVNSTHVGMSLSTLFSTHLSKSIWCKWQHLMGNCRLKRHSDMKYSAGSPIVNEWFKKFWIDNSNSYPRSGVWSMRL